MSIKKCVNGSFVNDVYREYGTDTDTITSLPQTIIGDGQNISAYTIKGNMTQSGTPTPSNPVYPTECGDKTANLFDYKYYFDNKVNTGGSNDWLAYQLEPNTAYTVSCNVPYIDNLAQMFVSLNNTSPSTANNGVGLNNPRTITTDSTGVLYILSRGATAPSPLVEVTKQLWEQSNWWLMLNSGSTALPYEPFGYEIPILSSGTTYPVYLAEPIRKISTYVDSVPSTGTASRVIKKLVLTGEENIIETANSFGYRFTVALANAQQSDTTVGVKSLCTHLTLVGTGHTYDTENAYTITSSSDLIMTLDSTYRLADFKGYLQQQYANGTPVTVWYVLATAQTESFTAPSIPTSGTAQSFDVDTTLKPSEVSLTWHGWHEHEDTKYSNP